jgi:prephenate dehydrogenase
VTRVYERAALVGTGGIGGSLFLALRQAGAIASAVGFDRSTEAAERARARGIVDAVAATAAEAVRGADLVVLAVPVRATAEVCEAIAPSVAAAPSVLVTDVGSTKAEVLAAVERALPFPERFVGGHPMAGSERSGPDAADAALFRGRRCLVVPSARARAEAVAECRALWERAGAQVELMDAARHDEAVALVSHLPHVAAFALAAAVGDAAAAEGLSGGGFVDTTRIAASDPVMWRDIFLSNAGPVLAAIERLDGELSGLRRAIARGDGAAIEAIIERARAGRRRVLGGRG